MKILVVKLVALGMAWGMVAAASGCGSINIDGDKDGDSDASSVPSDSGRGSNVPPIPLPEPDDLPKAFEGYVGGTFEVTVDGVSYSDMEDFYTKEKARLPAKVKQAGYDDSWTVEFKAQVGFSDLWRDMTVYLSPVDNAGFQGMTRVDESGHFAVDVPVAGMDHDYKVRANKRIGIVLTRNDVRHELCYNFSALDKSVTFTRDALPVILDAFVSTITAYECDLESDGDGVKVPPVAGQSDVLKFGDSKADATRILGIKSLTVESPTAWCWAYRPAPDSPCAATRPSTDGTPECDCRVTFDTSGVITALDGLSPSYTAKP